MIWSETWKQAISALRANKLRAALAMLGVVIGSGCIVLVVTLALAGKHYVMGQIEAVGSNIVYAELLDSGASPNSSLADQISIDDMNAVKAGIPQVVEVAGTNDILMKVVADGHARSVTLVGATPGFQRIRNLIVPRGRYFDPNDFSASNKVCLVTEHLAQLVFPDQNPIGRTIRANESSFTVIGVFRERVDTFGESEITMDSMLVPLPVIKYYTREGFIQTLYAQADRPEDVWQVTEEMARIVKSRHRREANYSVENLSSILDTAQHVSLAMTIVLLLVAGLALLISGIGIMNIMLVSVTERTREIGIRKAIGARRSQILRQFLVEAIMISGIGSLIGIAIAITIPAAMESLMRFLPVPDGIHIPISWMSVALALGISCATGMVFGYLPAEKAAGLETVDALRYE